MNRDSLTKKIDDFGLFLQAFLAIIMTILYVLSFFVTEFRILATIVLGCVLLLAGYNNGKIYHNKSLITMYIISGIIMIIVAFLGV